MNLAASTMVLRAAIQRNAAGNDGWGQKKAPTDWQDVATDVHCYVWVDKTRQVVDTAKDANVEEIRGVFPYDQDLRMNDRLVQLKDRAGRDVLAGFFNVADLADVGGLQTVKGSLRVQTVEPVTAMGRRSHLSVTFQRNR